MSSVFDHIIEGGETTKIEEGGSFSPTGLIGPVRASLMYRFWSMVDLDGMDGVPEGLAKFGKDESWFYYHSDKAKASLGASICEAYNPDQVWRVEMQSSQILNVKDTSDWNDVVSSECVIKGRGKRYHEFHLVSLPYFVQALALMAGYVDERIFHTDEVFGAAKCLTCGSIAKLIIPHYECPKCGKVDSSKLRIDDTIFTAELQAKLVGGEGSSYKDSVFWQRRTDLWKALGEDDPRKHNPIGTESKYDTTSEKLSSCLNVLVTQPWKVPLWVRLVNIPDPREKAVSKAERRLSLPAIWEIFTSEEVAIAASKAEASDDGGSDGGSTVSQPEIPDSWKKFADEWKKQVKKVKGKHSGEMPPLPLLVSEASDLSCDVSHIQAWWELV